MFLLLTGVAFFFCGSAVFASPIVVQPGPSQPFDQSDRISLEWEATGAEHYMWFEVYMVLNGELLVRKWFRGDEIEELSLSDVIGTAAPAAAGDYLWHVRGWDPINLMGSWSDAGIFSVGALELVAPALSSPKNEERFSGTWPLFYDYVGANPGATWAEIEFYQNEVLVRAQWVPYTHTGIGGVAADEIPAPDLELVLAPGEYSWRVREYSPDSLHGPWAEFRDFEISDVACATTSLPPQIRSIDLTHIASNTADLGNKPWIDVDFHGFRYVNLYINSTDPGDQFIFNEWIRFSDLSRGHGILPALAPRDYELWTRGHDRCGNITSWAASSEPFIIKGISEKPTKSDLQIQQMGFDRGGKAYFAWEAVPGYDWYQVQAFQYGVEILNQWVDLSSEPTSASVIQYEFDYETQRNTGFLWSALQTEGAGEVTFSVRHFLSPGTYSAWAESKITGPYDAGAPTLGTADIGSNRPSFSWDDVGGMGSYEIYISRDDALFLNFVLDLEEIGSSNRKSSEPRQYEVPLSWDSFFDFPSGTYKVWVRSTSGSLRGAWWTVVEFEI